MAESQPFTEEDVERCARAAAEAVGSDIFKEVAGVDPVHAAYDEEVRDEYRVQARGVLSVLVQDGRLLPPRLALADRARVRTPHGAMKCDLAEARRVAAEQGSLAHAERSTIALHSGGWVVLAPWEPDVQAGTDSDAEIDQVLSSANTALVEGLSAAVDTEANLTAIRAEAGTDSAPPAQGGCPETVWLDGVYKTRCGLGGSGVVCAKHGPFVPTHPEERA